MVLTVKICVLILSGLGLMAFFGERLKVGVCFVPATVICSQILLIYCFAVAGFLKWGVIFTVLLGCAVFLYELIRAPKSYAFLWSPQFLIFVSITAGVVLLNTRSFSISFDNYSHWALLPKVMYETNSLPLPGSVVSFFDYPPASSIFLYYILKLTFYSEKILALGQGLLFAGFLATLTGDFSWKNPLKLICSTGLICILALLCKFSLTSLQVDTLLGFISVAAAVALILPKIRGKEGPDYRVIVLFCSVLALTKKSGMLMVVFVMALGLLLWKKPRKNGLARSVLWCFAFTVLIPAVFAYSYSLRTKLVFGQAAKYAKFGLNTGKFSGAIANKSDGFLSDFPGIFLRGFVDTQFYTGKLMMVIYAVVLAALLITLLFRKKIQPTTRRLVLFSFIMMLSYIISVFTMYVFMMPENESVILASFDRYICTGLIFQTFLLMAAPLFTFSSENKKNTAEKIILCVCIPVMLLAVAKNVIVPDWQMQMFDEREKGMEVIAQSGEKIGPVLRQDDRPCFIVEDGLGPFAYGFSKYIYLHPIDGNMFTDTGEVKYPENKGSCYLVFLSKQADKNELVSKLTGIENPACGLYSRDEQGKWTCITTVGEYDFS